MSTKTKEFYHQESQIWNKDRPLDQNSKRSGHTFERSRYATREKQCLGKCIYVMDGFFGIENMD